MHLTTAWLNAIDGTNALNAEVEFSRHGYRHRIDVTDASTVAFEDTDPVRPFSSWPGKRNFEGYFWLASTGQHIAYESFWERAFLMSLDRAKSAVGVASQPMWLRWREPKRDHAPDYFVRRNDGTAILVDVKPKELTKPEDATKFELTRRLAAALGWSYVVFDELPGATEANLRFLLRYRDPAWTEGIDLALLGVPSEMRLGELARLLDGHAPSGIGAAYALIWCGEVGVDLSRPLSPASRVRLAVRS